MICNPEVMYGNQPHPSNFATNVEFLKAHREWVSARIDEQGRSAWPIVDRFMGVHYGPFASSDESEARYKSVWHPNTGGAAAGEGSGTLKILNLEKIGAFLRVRSMSGAIPDMEIVESYQGKQTEHKGKVELFFRETMFAKYNVLETVKTRLDELGVEYSHDPHTPFCGGEGQIFLTASEFAEVVALSTEAS